MATVQKSNGSFSVRAHAGDAKTLLAFNMGKTDARNSLASPFGVSRKRELATIS